MRMPLLFLIIATVVSAVAVFRSQHETRKLFVELYQLQKQRDEYNVEWGRLQLEQSTYADHSRIEKIARDKLQMILPQNYSTLEIH